MLHIDQGNGRDALEVYQEYKKKAEQFKSLRARSTEVVMAACLYCRICLNKLAPGETFDIKRIKDYALYQKLNDYCQGKGRNKRTSAFEE